MFWLPLSVICDPFCLTMSVRIVDSIACQFQSRAFHAAFPLLWNLLSARRVFIDKGRFSACPSPGHRPDSVQACCGWRAITGLSQTGADRTAVRDAGKDRYFSPFDFDVWPLTLLA